MRLGLVLVELYLVCAAVLLIICAEVDDRLVLLASVVLVFATWLFVYHKLATQLASAFFH